MKPVTPKQFTAALLVAVLFATSFFKDHFTPDHLNSPSAKFLASAKLSGSSRLSTLISHPAFWLAAIIYSGIFILVPYLVVKLLYDVKSAVYTGLLLLAAMLMMYAMVFIQLPSLDHHIVPKLNRYLHSPVIVLFIMAAFRLLASKNE